jgi:P27 family predicted phage terminase small subunit
MTRRTPTALRLIAGNPGKRSMPKDEPTAPPASSVEPPAWLSIEARREWRRSAKVLAAAGLLTRLDLATFAAYCDAVGDWRRADRLLRDRALVETTPAGASVQSTLLGIKRRARLDAIKFGSLLGMSPVSRVGLSITVGIPAAPAPKSNANERAERFF